MEYCPSLVNVVFHEAVVKNCLICIDGSVDLFRIKCVSYAFIVHFIYALNKLGVLEQHFEPICSVLIGAVNNILHEIRLCSLLVAAANIII